jgi:hypothetical protein
MKNFKPSKYGDTKIQFNEIDTHEVKIVDFICEQLRDDVFIKLTTQSNAANTWNPLSDPWR